MSFTDKTESNKKNGLSVNNIFENYGDENINILNGNLTLIQPNSPSYPVNGNFSYQLQRIYNSKIWALDENICFYNSPGGIPSAPVMISRSSMGTGWMFHLGRIYMIQHLPLSEKKYFYESSDGGSHRLWGPMPSGFYITKDTTYIKAYFNESTNSWKLMLPDGTIYYFTHYVPPTPAQQDYIYFVDDNYSGWYPTRIEDSWGNGINISYKTNNGLTHIIDTITDDHFNQNLNPDRKIEITAVTKNQNGELPDGWIVPRGVISKIKIPAINGYANYKFYYDIRRISTPFSQYQNTECCESLTCPCPTNPIIYSINPQGSCPANIDIEINGYNFCNSSKVKFYYLNDTEVEDYKIKVNSVSFINSSKLIASISISSSAADQNQDTKYKIRILNNKNDFSNWSYFTVYKLKDCNIHNCLKCGSRTNCNPDLSETLILSGENSASSSHISYAASTSDPNILDILVLSSNNTYLRLYKKGNSTPLFDKKINTTAPEHYFFYFSDACTGIYKNQQYSFASGTYYIKIEGENSSSQAQVMTFPCRYNDDINQSSILKWPNCNYKPISCTGQFPGNDSYYDCCDERAIFEEGLCDRLRYGKIHYCQALFSLADGANNESPLSDPIYISSYCTNNSFGEHIKGEVYNTRGQAYLDVYYSPSENGNYNLIKTFDLSKDYLFYITAELNGEYATGYYKFKIRANGKDNYAHVGFTRCLHPQKDFPEPPCDCSSPPCAGPDCLSNLSYKSFPSFTSSQISNTTCTSNSIQKNNLFNIYPNLNNLPPNASDLVRYKDDPYYEPAPLALSLSNKIPPGDRYAVLLIAVELPNGLKINYEYNDYGELTKVIYPTGGEVSYDYQEYGYVGCIGIIKGRDDVKIDISDELSREVKTKLVKVDNNHQYQWTYNRTFEPSPFVSNPTKTEIIDPLGNKTIYEFNYKELYPNNDNQYCDGDDSLVKKIQYKNSNNATLRTEEFEYQGDGAKKDNARLSFKKVTYNDDDNKFISTSYSDWDNYGHWRNECIQAYDGNNYMFKLNKKNYFACADQEQKYIVDTYNEISLFAGSGDCSENYSNLVSKKTFTFGNNCEIITEKRFAKPPEQSIDDVIINYSYDNYGNKIKEDFFKNSNLDYSLNYEYSFGVLKRKYYSGIPWNLFDKTIDKKTSLVTSEKDSAGLDTTYTYDKLYRITSTNPPQENSTKVFYEYNNNPNAIKVSKGDTASLYYYDGIGRLIELYKNKKNAASFSKQVTDYDELGRVAFKSEWVDQNINPKTIGKGTYYNYDVFDRVTNIENADGSSISYSYKGITQTAITTKVSKNPQITAHTTYKYDLFGRLKQVIDAEDYSTNYEYDGLDNLVQVSQGNQIRKFAYNALGNLLCASNPENGTTFFAERYNNTNDCSINNIKDDWYDAKGNLLKKIDNSDNTFIFQYDAAERLLSVKANNVIIKENDYDTPNRGYSTGKITNVRSYTDSGIQISERRYDYSGRGGRMSTIDTIYHKTIINPNLSGSYINRIYFNYNTDGLLDSLIYYNLFSPGNQPEKRRKIQYEYQRGFLTKIYSCAPAGNS